MLLFILIPVAYSKTYHHFNTSHVTVYLYVLRHTKSPAMHFNTSHVTVYRSNHLPTLSRNSYFNTSHVTVYLRLLCRLHTEYRISIHLMLLFILSSAILHKDCTSFQYISCYCLSQPPPHPKLDYIIFQYISCYCLSSTL